MKTGGSGGAGGTVTGGVGGTVAGGSGGTVAGGAGGTATGGSTGSGGTSTQGGSTGSGGIPGSGGDAGVGTGGAGGAGTGDAGDDGGPADTYTGCYHLSDPDEFVLVTKSGAQGMCVVLYIATNHPGPNTFGIVLPQGWSMHSAARWPVWTAPCTTATTFAWPQALTFATSGTGTVISSGKYGTAAFTMDVDVALTFPLGDSGASESETLQVKALPAGSVCK
jgi:hypothetical protein